LVFCKDIETATHLFAQLNANNPRKFFTQLYTGLGKEEDFINHASTPGMITITTSALGRNTDILYDKIAGLQVWHTFVDSPRGTEQKSGRTGRQGSIGEISFVLNKQDFNGRTIEEIKSQADEFAARERNINETLYNVLGNLLVIIDNLPPEQFSQAGNNSSANAAKAAFFKKFWPRFGADTEKRYRDYMRNNMMKNFSQDTLRSFEKMMGEAKIKHQPIQACYLEAPVYPERRKYQPYSAEVKLADCTPAFTVAYHCSYQEKNENEQLHATNIKEQLRQLFDHLSNSNFVVKHTQYLQYLLSNPITHAAIVAIHKEFLANYLQQNSQKLSFVKRWLGFEGKLNQIASNQNYLVMFYAFASISSQSAVDFNVIKQSVTTILDEYLENSWFINGERKQHALALKDKINAATDIDKLIDFLAEGQIEIARKDIATNQQRVWTKSIHFFGYSRYQTSLNHALNLATSLSAKTNIQQLTKGLTPLINDLTHKPATDSLTLDELKQQTKSPTKDKANRSIIVSCLENALAIKDRQDPIGMIGRLG